MTKGSPFQVGATSIWAFGRGGESKPLPGWFGALIQRKMVKNGKKIVKMVKNCKNGKKW